MAALWLLAAIPVLALFNVFGQRTSYERVAERAATVQLQAPQRLRRGVVYQVRVRVSAHQAIRRLRIVFGHGWWDGITSNGIVPVPSSQSSANGRVVLDYGGLAAGKTFTNWDYFQVNPTTAGTRTVSVDVLDGSQAIASLRRSLWIFP